MEQSHGRLSFDGLERARIPEVDLPRDIPLRDAWEVSRDLYRAAKILQDRCAPENSNVVSLEAEVRRQLARLIDEARHKAGFVDPPQS